MTAAFENLIDKDLLGYYDGELKDFIGGNYVAGQHTLAADVPADAVFTDTTYNPADPGTDGTDGTDGLMSDTDKYKLDNVEAGAEVNVLEGITVGGVAQTPSSKVIALGSAAGATLETAGVASDTTTIPTTAQVKSFVEGKGYQTASDVSSAIGSAIAGAYIPAGSKAANELTGSLLVAANLGKVYNLSNDLTIAAADKGNWVENAENSYPAGTNVVVVDDGTAGSPSYKFDAIAGFVDLSGYVPASDISLATNSDIDALFATE